MSLARADGFSVLIDSAYTEDMAATQTTLPADEVSRVVATLPLDAQKEVLDFALFLQSRIAADDAQWESAFAETDSAKLRAWLDVEKADDDDLQPMFDAAGNIVL